MKTKVAPTVSQTIKITIEGKIYELSKDEATKLYDGLMLSLNLPTPIQWNPPVVIERNPYSPPYSPHWPPHHWWDTHTICQANDQAVQSGDGRIFNLCDSSR